MKNQRRQKFDPIILHPGRMLTHWMMRLLSVMTFSLIYSLSGVCTDVYLRYFAVKLQGSAHILPTSIMASLNSHTIAGKIFFSWCEGL